MSGTLTRDSNLANCSISDDFDFLWDPVHQKRARELSSRYDLDITKDGGVKVFDNLFKKADYYDDLLKNEFGCLDRIEE